VVGLEEPVENPLPEFLGKVYCGARKSFMIDINMDMGSMAEKGIVEDCSYGHMVVDLL
jgi:hypothetical protein